MNDLRVKALCDWWKQRRGSEASDLPQAFIAKWLPVISETTFHFKAPDVVVFLLLLLLLLWGRLSLLGSNLLPVVFLYKKKCTLTNSGVTVTFKLKVRRRPNS